MSLLGVGALALLLAAAPSGKPDDTNIHWSPDARYVAFNRAGEARPVAYVVPAGHGSARRVGVGFVTGWASEDTVDLSGTVVGLDGRVRFRYSGSHGGWLPDGSRVAFFSGGDLVVADARGGQRRIFARGVGVSVWDATGPVWSHDGMRIAFTDAAAGEGSKLAILDLATGAVRIVFSDSHQNVDPSWSPDDSTLAFESNREISLVGADGTNWQGFAEGRFPQWHPTQKDALLYVVPEPYSPATGADYTLYVGHPISRAPSVRLADDVHPDTSPRWSPTGAQVAFVSGRECLRWGVYVTRSEWPYTYSQHRRSNDCHVDGTNRADVLTGTPWVDVIRGLGGDDRIDAGADADHVDGGGGNDTIDAGKGANVVSGGPGDDVISGGRGNDEIRGGPGRDRISSGLGMDAVDVEDGRRDVVDCGAGPNDSAVADVFDVLQGCEHVVRR
jgi:Ca2+-binding RTX toxin-like protein